MTIDGKKYWEENNWKGAMIEKHFSEYADTMGAMLVEAYKLGYSDRTHKTPPFSDQDPKEYVLDHLSRV